MLAEKYINDYVRENFRIIQLDLWGSREVTDFDGTRLTEKALAERWGVIFTPTIVFFKDDLSGLDGKWGRPLEAIERLPLSYGPDTFYDLFVWVRLKLYERDGNFQRFHILRVAEREALATEVLRPAGGQLMGAFLVVEVGSPWRYEAPARRPAGLAAPVANAPSLR